MKRVGTGVAQPQGRGDQRVPATAEVAYEHRHVRGHQTGTVHGLGKGDGLLQQGGIVHFRQSLRVDLEAGILTTCVGGAEYRVDQLQRVVAYITTQRTRLLHADCNLRHHLFNTLHLDRALRQNPPDLGHQVLQKIPVAQVLKQVVIEILNGVTQPIGPQPVALLQIAAHQVEIHRQHLGEKMMGMFRRDGGMGVVAPGHGKQADLAQDFDQRCGGVTVAHRAPGQRGHQRLRVVPVAATKKTGPLNGGHALIKRLQAFGTGHQGLCCLDHLENRRNALNGIDFSKAADGRVECCHGRLWGAVILRFGFMSSSVHSRRPLGAKLGQPLLEWQSHYYLVH